jgi:hypothetical protein
MGVDHLPITRLNDLNVGVGLLQTLSQVVVGSKTSHKKDCLNFGYLPVSRSRDELLYFDFRAFRMLVLHALEIHLVNLVFDYLQDVNNDWVEDPLQLGPGRFIRLRLPFKEAGETYCVSV